MSAVSRSYCSWVLILLFAAGWFFPLAAEARAAAQPLSGHMATHKASAACDGLATQSQTACTGHTSATCHCPAEPAHTGVDAPCAKKLCCQILTIATEHAWSILYAPPRATALTMFDEARLSFDHHTDLFRPPRGMAAPFIFTG